MKRRSKFIVYIVLIISAIALLFFVLHLNNSRNNNKKIAYHKEVNLNYVTNLKDNKFYSSSYLEDNYNFVASLIDNFKIDYSYLYTLSEKVNYILTYDVSAVLEVYDSENKDKPIEKNTYELVPKTTTSGEGEIIKIDLFNQIIDYQTYNKIIQNWKREVSPDATLTVYFNVKWDGNTSDQQLSDSYNMDLKIPISQKTISISKPTNVYVDDVITKKDNISIGFLVMLVSNIILMVALVLRLMLFIIAINRHKDKYEAEINKILREYDRAITEAKGSFELSEEDNNVEVNTFLELMDVHDNLNVPIIFYRDSDSRCIFVVRDSVNVYYCIIRRSSFDN